MNTNFPQPEDKAEVLENIRQARAELETSFARLSHEQMDGPATDGGWTIKDHLSHIAEWQRRALAVMDGREPHEGFQIDKETFDQFEDVHALNEYLFQRNRNRSLEDVLEDFRSTHQQVEARVGEMDNDQLQSELTGTLARRFPRVVDLVNFNIARHDRVHVGDIEDLASRER
jgi:hypothetical protein